MKKLLIATWIFILPLLAHLAFALHGRTPEERAEKLTTMMEKELKLTEDQLPKIKEINLKYAEKNAQLMEGQKKEKEVMIEAYRGSEKKKEEKLAQVLTEEQLKIYLEKKQEMRARRGAKRVNHNRKR